MYRCHRCGEKVADDDRSVRSIQTGNYSAGGAMFRDVNLCSKCDAQETTRRFRTHLARVALVVAACAGILVGGYYLLFVR